MGQGGEDAPGFGGGPLTDAVWGRMQLNLTPSVSCTQAPAGRIWVTVKPQTWGELHLQ